MPGKSGLDVLRELRTSFDSRLPILVMTAYGSSNVAIEAILDSAERQARTVIAGWKDGVYKGEAILDDDGHVYRDVHIRATVTKGGDGLTVDLSDSHRQVSGFVNSSFPNTMSAVHMAFAYLIDPRTPKNSGSFRAVKVLTKPGTIVHPNPPAPVIRIARAISSCSA